MTVAVLASCLRPALWTWPSCLYLQALPDFFRGQWPEKSTIIRGDAAAAQAKLRLFVKSAQRQSGKRRRHHESSQAGPLCSNAAPCNPRKKTQVGLDLGLNPPKEEGGGDTGRSTGPVMAGGAGKRCGTFLAFAFALWRALHAPSFDGMNYTYSPSGCKKICSTKRDTTI